jgi:hypothetical protein
MNGIEKKFHNKDMKNSKKRKIKQEKNKILGLIMIKLKINKNCRSNIKKLFLTYGKK